MRQAEIIRYSMSFKQQLIRELESGRFSSLEEAREHYGILGTATIQSWLRRYGKNHLCPKLVRIEMPNEKDQIKELKKQIKQLQEALGYTQAENVLNQTFLKMACEKFGLDVDEFKKKADSTLSEKPEKDQKQK